MPSVVSKRARLNHWNSKLKERAAEASERPSGGGDHSDSAQEDDSRIPMSRQFAHRHRARDGLGGSSERKKLSRSTGVRRLRHAVSTDVGPEAHRKLSSVSLPETETGRSRTWSGLSQDSNLSLPATISSAGGITTAACADCTPSGRANGARVPRSDVDPTTWTREEEEYIYRQLLQCVLNPLGTPDTRPGFRPTDLARHLKQVFGVPEEVHDRLHKEVENNKPTNVVVNVTVYEAKDIKPMDSNGLSDPYCLLSVVNNKTPRGSPRGGSPHGSPHTRRRRSSEHDEVLKTNTIKGTLHPRWNEEFELEVKDVRTEELLVYVWDSDEGDTVIDSFKQLDRPSGLKSWFRQIKQTVEFGKIVDDFIGQVRVPLRDIPAAGIDKWFDLYEDKKKRTKTQGQIHLKLELAVKQQIDLDQSDSAESDQCSVEDYYRVVKQMYVHMVKQLQEMRKSGPPAKNLRLPSPSQTVLDQFSSVNHFSKATQSLINLVVLMETAVEMPTVCKLSETEIKIEIANIEAAWLTYQQNTSAMRYDSFDVKPQFITNTELCIFDKAATRYIQYSVNNHNDIPSLFPPCDLHQGELSRKSSVLSNLLNLHFWTSSESTAMNDLSFLLVERLKDDVRRWLQSQLSEVHSPERDAVIPETKMLVKVLQQATTSVAPIFSISQFFSRLGIDYYKTVSMHIQSRLSKKAQDLMHEMDRYQLRYNKHSANIHQSSTVSLQLYLALHNFCQMVKGNLSDRELFKLDVGLYQSWFQGAIAFWLQTFRQECIRRMEKALEIEKDVVQVTSLVKYSNSSVDVLSCFVKITDEWKQIGFHDADHALLGVTKITDTICDGSRQYADKIACILENNGYYDMDDNNQFDVTDQMCISMNNMEHVRQYLSELPKLLNYDQVTHAMSEKHEDKKIGQAALKTLNRLIRNADRDMLMKRQVMIQNIIDKIAVDLVKLVSKFTQDEPDNAASIDPLMAYLDTNIQILFERLMASIFPYMLQQTWGAVLESVSDTVLTGRQPHYYVQMLAHVRTLKDYFCRGSADEELGFMNLYESLVMKMEQNSMASEELMLSYLTSYEDSLQTPLDYYGHLTIKVGYMEETHGNITIHVKVVEGHALPGMTKKNLSDPCVSVSLWPATMFNQSKPYKTRVVNQTVRPVFNETYQWPSIPKEYMSMEGACVIFTVWHHDTILPNDFLGEVIVHLKSLREMTSRQRVDDLLTLIIPLKRPVEPSSGPFQVLKDRSTWDRASRTFVHHRKIIAGYLPPHPLCGNFKSALAKLRGRKTLVPHSSGTHNPFTAL